MCMCNTSTGRPIVSHYHVTSPVAVLKLPYGKINVFDKLVIEKQTRKNTEIKEFFPYLHLKHGLEMEFTAC